jgi:hypothetical protein
LNGTKEHFAMKVNKNAFSLIMIVGLGLLLLAGISGCSKPADEGAIIANLDYATLRAPMDENGVFTVTGSFDVIRAQGETVSVNTVVYDSQGKEIAKASIPLTDEALRKSNTLAFGVDCSTTKKGVYTFITSVKDANGRTSNGLMGTFAITDIY